MEEIENDPRTRPIQLFLEAWEQCETPAMMENLAAAIKVDPRLVSLSIITVYRDCLLPALNPTFPVQQARAAVEWGMKVLGKEHKKYKDGGMYAFRYVDDAIRRLSISPVENGVFNKSNDFNTKAVRAVRSILTPTVLKARLMDMEVDELLEALAKVKAINEEIARQRAEKQSQMN